MTDLFGCQCCVCDQWHSHVFPVEYGRFICINCKNKKEVKGDEIQRH